ncbi:MAG TPA: serpin family protein, partial [Syntrophales bacterium]|nr:serpin family protein [Syntrophales bacterium]
MYRMGIFIICMSLAALFALSGCTSSDDDHSSSSSTTVTANEPTLVKSDVERDTSPDVAGEDIATLVEDNTAFTFDLYHILVDEKPDENRFFSPYSISLCSAMVYGGARNNTETQMKDALHYTLNQDTLHPAFNALSLDLTSREQDYNDDGEKDFQLNIVNSMCGQTFYDFL